MASRVLGTLYFLGHEGEGCEKPIISVFQRIKQPLILNKFKAYGFFSIAAVKCLISCIKAINMCNPIFSKRKTAVKALLLLGVYLLHFAFFQTVVAGFSGSGLFSSKSFFSSSQRSSNPNSGIATFRTLEKHEVSQQTYKLLPDLSESVSILFNLVFKMDMQHQQAAIPVFLFSDSSYRLYVRDCVFRI